jgi:hypothetical protein
MTKNAEPTGSAAPCAGQPSPLPRLAAGRRLCERMWDVDAIRPASPGLDL